MISILPESHRRLGRHVEHDPASLAYPAAVAPQIITTVHIRHCPPYDQGNLGSCTGNAMAGLLMTGPFWQPSRTLTEADAVNLYEKATHLDGVPGVYPPDDTGSSGLAVAKAAKAHGWIAGYRHAFGLNHALGALTVAPVIIGINWYDSFDTPDKNGLIRITPGAQVRGGHEVCLRAVSVENRQMRGTNSWGASWGLGGEFLLGWDDLARLLAEHGDVTTAH